MRRIAFLLLLLLVPFALHAAAAVVAKVNDAVITEQQLAEEVGRLIPKMSFHGKISEEKREQFRTDALENLTTRELQYQDALAKGMKPDKKFVKEQVGRVRERFESKGAFKKALEQAGITEDDLYSRMEREVLVSQVIARMVTEPARMTDDAVKDYYTKNRDKFVQPESARLRIISSKDEKKARDAHARVKAGEDFGTVAAKMSEDDYRIKGGDIGFVHKGMLEPEIEEAAFLMKPGEVRGLIKTAKMWFIVKVEERKPQHQVGFEEIRDRLKNDLESKKREELLQAWTSDMRARAKIEILRSSSNP
ncbi:MAG: peptidyl-prolyl cis-trans isomerase [Nitrospirota bacterium]